MGQKQTAASSSPELSSLSLAITEHAPLPMATVEGATHLVRYANPAFCRLLNRPIKRLIGQPLSKLLPKKDPCVTLLNRVYQTQKAESFTEQEATKAHPVFWSYTIWPVMEDKGLVGIMIQVTETAEVHGTTVAMNQALVLGSLRQHELTSAAEDLNQKLRVEITTKAKIATHLASTAHKLFAKARDLAEKARLLDLSHDAIIVRDIKGHIRYWNHGAEEIYGWSRKQAMGKPIHTLLQTKFPVPLKQITAELHRTNRWSGELIQTKRNGHRITVLARKTLDRDHQGHPAALLESITDITERKQAEETKRRIAALAASNQKLEQEIIHRQKTEEALSLSEQEARKHLQQSRAMQEELRLLSRQVLTSQEDERKRISRELHDVIAQILTGINVRLAALAKEAATNTKHLDRSIASTQKLVSESVDIVHKFARELRPAVLDDFGLVPALQSFLENFIASTGIRASLTAFAGVKELSTEGRTVLFRVVQEALTNVIRHAQASRVELIIEQCGKNICLKIKNDGQAFQVEKILHASVNKRLGILGMRERVEMIGGTFTIISAPGHGTTVQVEIPFNKMRGGARLFPLEKI